MNNDAFAFPSLALRYEANGTSQLTHGAPGLTKREFFAILQMQGIGLGRSGMSAKDIAILAVEQADALIKELAKPIKEKVNE